MRSVSREEFFAIAESLGLGNDPRYPGSGNLFFLPRIEDASRFWVYPTDIESCSHFVETLLAAGEVEENVMACPKAGPWKMIAPAVKKLGEDGEKLATVLAVPESGSSAVEFDSAERPMLLATLLGQMLSPMYDLWALPLSGETLLHFGHHGAVYVV